MSPSRPKFTGPGPSSCHSLWACGLKGFLCGHALTHCFPGAERVAWTLTTVCVDVVGLEEPDFEVVENRRLMQVAQGRQVILSHQDIRIA